MYDRTRGGILERRSTGLADATRVETSGLQASAGIGTDRYDMPSTLASANVDNLNRWYDSTVGQWLSEDPIGFVADDTNLCRYVRNQPNHWADPNGTVPPGDAASGLTLKQWLELRDDKTITRCTELVESLPNDQFGTTQLTRPPEVKFKVVEAHNTCHIRWKTCVTPIEMKVARVVGGLQLPPEALKLTINHEDRHAAALLRPAQNLDSEVVQKLDKDLQDVAINIRHDRADKVVAFLNTNGPTWLKTRLLVEEVRQKYHFDHLADPTRGVVGGVYHVYNNMTYQTVWDMPETQQDFLATLQGATWITQKPQTVAEGVDFIKKNVAALDGPQLKMIYDEGKAILNRP